MQQIRIRLADILRWINSLPIWPRIALLFLPLASCCCLSYFGFIYFYPPTEELSSELSEELPGEVVSELVLPTLPLETDSSQPPATLPPPSATPLAWYERIPELDYRGMFMVEQDVDFHAAVLQMIADAELYVRMDIAKSRIMIEGPPPFVSLEGDFSPGGSFVAFGSGTVVGFSGIQVRGEGTISESELRFEFAMGIGGGFPGGNPITYSFYGMRQIPDEEITLVDALLEIQAFYAIFNRAFEEGDTGTLLLKLHPSVTDYYGTESCDSYLQGVIENPLRVDPQQVTAFGDWDWQVNSSSIRVTDAYTVNVTITLPDGAETQQEIHLAIRPDGQLGWFTYCEPAAE